VDIVPRLREVAGGLQGRAGTALEALESTLESIRHKGNRQLLIENFLMDLLPGRPATATPQSGSLVAPRG
jgi:hypothetical protein